MLRKDFSINLDGEIFFYKKVKLKKMLIQGAKKYYVAGTKATENVRKILKTENAFPYYFSSLSENDLKENKINYNKSKNANFVLIVGRYVKEKGLDIALEIAKLNSNVNFKFIGMGKKEKEIIEKKAVELNIENVKFVPFLEKMDLAKQYRECRCLLMPSIQECWGLVINEAASFGTPIVSTWGSGAAIEFLKDNYSKFLAEPNNIEELNKKLNDLLECKDINKYKEFLIKKSQNYSIEKSVESYMQIINKDIIR